MEIHKGDIFYADLSPVIGSEQGGVRPVVVIQNNVGNHYSPTVIVAPITSRKKRWLPTHVKLNKHTTGLYKPSFVMLEQIRTIDRTRLIRYLETLDEKTMDKVDKAISISFGLPEAH